MFGLNLDLLKAVNFRDWIGEGKKAIVKLVKLFLLMRWDKAC